MRVLRFAGLIGEVLRADELADGMLGCEREIGTPGMSDVDRPARVPIGPRCPHGP